MKFWRSFFKSAQTNKREQKEEKKTTAASINKGRGHFLSFAGVPEEFSLPLSLSGDSGFGNGIGRRATLAKSEGLKGAVPEQKRIQVKIFIIKDVQNYSCVNKSCLCLESLDTTLYHLDAGIDYKGHQTLDLLILLLIFTFFPF